MGADEAHNRLDNMILLIRIQFRIYRYGNGFLGGTFRFRKRTRLIFQIVEAFLTMEWNGVIDLVADSVLYKMSSQIIPDGFRDCGH